MLPVRSSPVYRPLLCYGATLLPGHFVYYRHPCPFGQKKVSLLKHPILSKSHFTNYPSHTYSFPSHPIFPFPLTFLVLSCLQDIAHAKAGFQHVRYTTLYRRSLRVWRSLQRSCSLRSTIHQEERAENQGIETSCTNNRNRVALIRNIPSRTLSNKNQSCLSIYFPLCYITS